MFRSILIANRGEIACRVIDTCRRMGVGTVAVYSDADAGAAHVALADTGVRIGPAAPAQSYLRGDVIIQAALDTGAEAIHPGYGFLSENPEFAQAVANAGLTFIGPPPDAIRAMGLKDAAKALMEKAGVPVVPGYHGPDQDPGHLEVEAATIGYPVLIKAVAGGGGKGMRLVEAEHEFINALEAAKSEALGAFGNDAVLIEKYLERPRHIEVQVFGDGSDAVHLFERDCSLQRRHQKVIEEAPAPGMTAEVRAAMGDAAVRAARAIGYSGAGTVEFIVDGSGPLRPDGFWFMEMNTRLQVEHPVTEAITGVDLVEWQLRVAAGEGLPLAQEDLSISGHAFEARIYAEDVPAGFLPATGRLTHLVFPKGVRVDSGIRAGDSIGAFYDPMIAKLTAHGASRDIALGRLQQALGRTQIAGCTTNIAFLRALSQHPHMRSGTVDTGLVARELETLAARPVPCHRSRALAVVAASGLTGGGAPLAGFTLWQPLWRDVPLEWQGEPMHARISVRGPGRYAVALAQEQIAVTGAGGQWDIDGQTVRADLHASAGGVTVFFGNAYAFSCPDPLARGGAAAVAGGQIVAPMPGQVRAVMVRAGDSVAAGDRLATLEAMKMEHVLRAPRTGEVTEVRVAEGDQVEAGALMLVLGGDT